MTLINQNMIMILHPFAYTHALFLHFFTFELRGIFRGLAEQSNKTTLTRLKRLSVPSAVQEHFYIMYNPWAFPTTDNSEYDRINRISTILGFATAAMTILGQQLI